MTLLLRQNRLLIYRLKREFGVTITYKKPTSQTRNVQTGRLVTTYQTFTIKRAPMLPAQHGRAIFNASGGEFDSSHRVVLIDVVDLPSGFQPDLRDHIIFETIQWNIKQIQEAEDSRSFHLLLQRTRGT